MSDGMSMNWDCPYCGRSVTITDDRFEEHKHAFHKGSKHGSVRFTMTAFICPNEECKELTLFGALDAGYYPPGSGWTKTADLMEWQLMPAARMKVFPDYIPEVILSDYREACSIRALSPKASATLSRRVLQGMIRDYWKIVKPRLKNEIDALEGKVDPDTWEAIDAVREIGNIGAHMEKDINVIVDVDPEEAELLIGLVETLLTDWYVQRHKRAARNNALKSSVAGKTELRVQTRNPEPAGTPNGEPSEPTV